jgi:putative peptidoglycan lipid II flippase
VTCVSIPIYALLFHRVGVSGLAIASNFGILAHTIALAILLHKYRLVSIACLEWAELGRAALAAVIAYAAVSVLASYHVAGTLHGYAADLVQIALGTVLWGGLCVGVLQVTGSKLIQQLRRRGV